MSETWGIAFFGEGTAAPVLVVNGLQRDEAIGAAAAMTVRREREGKRGRYLGVRTRPQPAPEVQP